MVERFSDRFHPTCRHSTVESLFVSIISLSVVTINTMSTGAAPMKSCAFTIVPSHIDTARDNRATTNSFSCLLDDDDDGFPPWSSAGRGFSSSFYAA